MIAYIMTASTVTGFLLVIFLGMLASGSPVGVVIGAPFTIVTAGMLFKLISLFFREVRDMK